MTEKKLLILAAKAAGYEIVDDRGVIDYCETRGLWANTAPGLWRWWNPPTDDGDALRLAVILGMNINVVTSGVFVSRFEDEPVIAEKTNDDVYAATRRAITRAAAEIGKAI